MTAGRKPCLAYRRARGGYRASGSYLWDCLIISSLAARLLALVLLVGSFNLLMSYLGLTSFGHSALRRRRLRFWSDASELRRRHQLWPSDERSAGALLLQ